MLPKSYHGRAGTQKVSYHGVQGSVHVCTSCGHTDSSGLGLCPCTRRLHTLSSGAGPVVAVASESNELVRLEKLVVVEAVGE
jgi:hypothetical protein